MTTQQLIATKYQPISDVLSVQHGKLQVYENREWAWVAHTIDATQTEPDPTVAAVLEKYGFKMSTKRTVLLETGGLFWYYRTAKLSPNDLAAITGSIAEPEPAKTQPEPDQDWIILQQFLATYG